MTQVVSLIWFWSLAILPMTAIITFVATIVVCSQVPNNAPADEKFPQISQLGTGEAYAYFVGGFVILSVQLFVILVGRIRFLFQTQRIIHRAVIGAIHGIGFLSIVFLLLMATASIDKYPPVHLTGAFGLFGLISLYCFLHTIAVFYLFIHRSDAPQHSTVLWPVWFLFCSIVLIGFFITWLVTSEGIPEYLAATTPFLYFLGFAPQFWVQAKSKKRNSVLFDMISFANQENQ